MTLDPCRRAALTDMAYELGGVGLAAFTHFLAAIRAESWSVAATELKNSRLFSQVPKREQRNIIILATGQFPPGVASVEDLIKLNEGCKFTASPDTKEWSIGYGHDIPMPGGAAPTCTQAEADEWFADDLALAEARAQADLGTEYW